MSRSGRFVRDHGVLPLEEAVRRATSLPADRLGLRDIGRVAEGCRADLVVLDPATVADVGWPDHPPGTPDGIERVLVAGTVMVEHGKLVGGPGHGQLL